MTTAPPFTYDDLWSFPDDHYRREIIEGQLIVSPLPGLLHQRWIGELLFVLHPAVPKHLELLIGPIDVLFDQSNVLVPDLVVVPPTVLDEPNITELPPLVVEVASPSTKRTDRTLKVATYEAWRVPSYWLADPDGPALTIWELDGDRYGEPVTITGDQTLTVERPFPVELSPARLPRRRR